MMKKYYTFLKMNVTDNKNLRYLCSGKDSKQFDTPANQF